MSKKILISFLLLCCTLAVGQEKPLNMFSIKEKMSLEARGFNVLTTHQPLHFPRIADSTQAEEFIQIEISFNSSSSKPMLIVQRVLLRAAAI